MFVKRVSRAVATIVASLVIVLVCFTLFGCEATTLAPEVFTVNFKNGEVVEKMEIEVAGLEGKTVYDAIKSDKYKAEFNAVLNEKDPAFVFISSIKGINPNAANNEFIAIYCSQAVFSIGDEYKMEFNGKTMYSSSKGIAELPVVAGAVYLFSLATW